MIIQRVSNLEFDKWDALRRAIDQLIANGTYQRFVDYHLGPHEMHRSLRFLPWHRAYLINFERELRAIDESLSIPYWDWIADGGALRGFSDLLGLSSGRTPANNRPSFFATEDQIQRILRQTNYANFTRALETGPHNTGHVWVGGDMATMRSPRDAAFWFHHAQVDRIWALWQQDHPDEMADLSGDQARMDPWEDEFDVRSVNNIYGFGRDSYRYVEPGGTVTDPVRMPDTALQAVVRSALGLASNAPITAQALKGLRHLSAKQSGIRDLTGLEHATNLRRLYLVNNEITHLQPLAGLRNLQHLYLGRNSIENVQPLTGLTNLQELGLANNNIRNIEPLRRLIVLQKLYLRNDDISDVQPLAGLVNLQNLNLSGNNIMDVQPLTSLTNLQSLNLSDNNITDVQPLTSLTNLYRLYLSGNPNLVDTSPLANLNLKKVDFEIQPKLLRYVHIKTLEGHTDGIEALAFSTDNSQLASCSRDGTIRLWDGRTGEYLRTLTGHNGPIHSVAFKPGAFELASVGDHSGNHTVRKWDTNTGRTHIRGRHLWAVTVAYHPRGHTLASGASGSAAPNTINLWDSGSDALRCTLEGHTDSVTSVAWSPDGRTLASGSYDHTIRLWNPNNRGCIATLNGHTGWVSSVVFSPNGQLLASGSYDQTIRLWDLNTRRTVRVLRGPGGRAQVTSVAFHPNGHILASGHLHDNNLHLWNVNTGERITTLTGHTWNVISVAFSSNGILASGGGNDDTIRLWADG